MSALIASPPEELLTMKLRDLLLAVPMLGVVKLRRMMLTCQIAEPKTVGGLSDRQRQAILDELARRA